MSYTVLRCGLRKCKFGVHGCEDGDRVLYAIYENATQALYIVEGRLRDSYPVMWKCLMVEEYHYHWVRRHSRCPSSGTSSTTADMAHVAYMHGMLRCLYT